MAMALAKKEMRLSKKKIEVAQVYGRKSDLTIISAWAADPL
jgi:hypothetical protein